VCHRLLIHHPPTTPCGSTYRWPNGTSAVASARAKERRRAEGEGGGGAGRRTNCCNAVYFHLPSPPPSSRLAPSPHPGARDASNSVFLSVYLSLSLILLASSSLLSHEITNDRYGLGENRGAFSVRPLSPSLFPFASSLTRFSQSTHPRTAAEREFNSQPSDPDSRDVSVDSHVAAFLEHFPCVVCVFLFFFLFPEPTWSLTY